MICRDFPLLYSAQLDGQSLEQDRIALQRHLRECLTCYRSAADMRRLRADLRALPAPLSSADLTGQIQMRLRQEAEGQRAPSAVVSRGKLRWGWGDFRRFWFNSFANWMDGPRVKIFSRTVGALVSLPIFFFVVICNQAHPATRSSPLATQSVYEDQDDKITRYQALFKAALFPTPPPPSFNPTYEFVDAAADLHEEDVILTAEVRKDGGAANVVYLLPPNEPSIQEKLSTAMAQRGIFAKPNQNISPIAVVYLSSMTTTGRL